MSRYEVSSDEDCVPGYPDILTNYLNLTDANILSQKETEVLELVYKYYIMNIGPDDIITPSIIIEAHEKWLGKIYPCAGKYRSVFMTKDGFPFAVPNMIDSLMHKFGNGELKKYTPCHNKNIDDLALALSIVHIEFILIHPFREGNGRIARLISDIMALQSGFPLLNFGSIAKNNSKGFMSYINAIHLGIDKNYQSMKDVFVKIINDSLEKP